MLKNSHHSEKTKRIMSERHKGKKPMLGKRLSAESKEKISKALSGRQLSEYTKTKISEAKKGEGNPLFGKHHSMGTREKMRNAKKGILPQNISQIAGWNKGLNLPYMQGEKHPNWQGGISFEPYTTDWTKTLKRAIRERDNHTCQICNQYGNHVHHIDYQKKNCDIFNLITLCNNCHMKTNYNRSYWVNYFLKYKRF